MSSGVNNKPVERAQQLASHFLRIQKLLACQESVIVSKWVISLRKAPKIHNSQVRAKKDLEKMMMRYSCKEYLSPCISLVLDGAQFAWVWKNMKHCPKFRNRFSQVYRDEQMDNSPSTELQSQNSSLLKVHFVILDSCLLVIDKIGSTLSNSYVSIRCEMETALSWLSTLGGAFSALGDISIDYAVEAAQVSMKQLRIAWKLNDPLIESRCRLYMAISLMQRGSLREARLMVKKEYRYALSLPEGMDPKLRRMCLGVWAKLQYAWTMRQKRIASSLPKCDNGKCYTNNFSGMNNVHQRQSNMPKS